MASDDPLSSLSSPLSSSTGPGATLNAAAPAFYPSFGRTFSSASTATAREDLFREPFSAPSPTEEVLRDDEASGTLNSTAAGAPEEDVWKEQVSVGRPKTLDPSVSEWTPSSSRLAAASTALAQDEEAQQEQEEFSYSSTSSPLPVPVPVPAGAHSAIDPLNLGGLSDDLPQPHQPPGGLSLTPTAAAGAHEGTPTLSSFMRRDAALAAARRVSDAASSSVDGASSTSSSSFEPEVASSTPLPVQLEQACISGNLRVLRRLLPPSGDRSFTLVNAARPHTGVTLLHLASGAGHGSIVTFLLQSGAIVGLEDGEGETALHRAALAGHLDCVKLLVDGGAEVDARDRDGWTALHGASAGGYVDVVGELLERGAEKEGRSKRGYTCLMNAASKGHLPLVSYLLSKASADPLARNAYGETAFDAAAAVGEVYICSLLALYERARLEMEGGDDQDLLKVESRHGTVPVAVWEHQRLALPSASTSTVGDLLAFAVGGQQPKWTSRAISGRDGVAAWVYDPLLGGAEELQGLPCFKSEVKLPLVGSEAELRLPRRRRVHPGGRVGRPVTQRAAGSAQSSATQTAASSPRLRAAGEAGTTEEEEEAWFWISEWSVDLSSPSASHTDGWSYASSFAAPQCDWAAEPPTELVAGEKYVRRRRWVRVMRRRVDRPDWGFGPSSASSGASTSAAEAGVATQQAGDYLERAAFLAGAGEDHDVDFEETEGTEESKRKALTRLGSALSELRAGLSTDENGERRQRAESVLDGLLRRQALLRASLGADDDDEEEGSDEEFVYDGQDADEDDDARSVWTTRGGRAESVLSNGNSIPAPPPPAAAAVAGYEPPSLAHLVQHQLLTSSSSRAARTWEPDANVPDCRRCTRRFTFFNRKHHCRRCGEVVCATCSSNWDRLEPAEVVREPGIREPGIVDTYRTCDTCHEELARLSAAATYASNRTFFPSFGGPSSSAPTADSSASSASSVIEGSLSSQMSELADCPVCGVGIGGMGMAEREEHLKDCFERGQGSFADTGGRYLTFRLQPGPLVGDECRICFEELEVGDGLARLACLCTFHKSCIRAWLNRGKACPFHANNRDC